MSNSYLHKNKGKSKRGIYGKFFKDYPIDVQKYYDRKCGVIDDKLEKIKIVEKINRKTI